MIAINGSSIKVKANIATRNQLKLAFSNQTSGGMDMRRECWKNLLTKSRNGISNNKREPPVSFFGFVVRDFIF